jgi:hypothetical protein
MIIHWFRRDLRLHDNSALAAAAHDSGGAVLPAFILDDAILTGWFASPARAAFLLAGLRTLDTDLRVRGLRLIVRRGDPLESTKKSGGIPTTFTLMSALVHICPPDFLVLSRMVAERSAGYKSHARRCDHHPASLVEHMRAADLPWSAITCRA